MDSIIDFCIVPGEQCLQWKKCIAEYRYALLLLRKKADLTNDEIRKFQKHVDAFFVSWVSLVSHEGVTNYIHMLGAGHIGEYLLYHRNLYKHSQQGWEGFNFLLKTFFFCHTGRGGAGNRGTSMKSKIKPIAWWLSWCVVWLMGYDYDTIVQELAKLEHANNYDDDDSYDDSNSDIESDVNNNDEIVEENDDDISI